MHLKIFAIPLLAILVANPTPTSPFLQIYKWELEVWNQSHRIFDDFIWVLETYHPNGAQFCHNFDMIMNGKLNSYEFTLSARLKDPNALELRFYQDAGCKGKILSSVYGPHIDHDVWKDKPNPRYASSWMVVHQGI